MSTHRVRSTVSIDASAELVWELLTVYSYWAQWGPSIRDVEAGRDRIEAGATGEVLTTLGVKLGFEITEFEPRRSWAWKVGGVEATGHHVEDLGEGRCRVEFDVSAVFFPYVLILRRGLKRLKALAESSDPLGREHLDRDAG